MNDSRRCVTEAQPIDPMREVLSVLVEHRTDVDMAAREMQTFPSDNVEVPGYLIERQRSMNPAGVKRFGRLIGALG